MTRVEVIARAICKSGKLETGEGTCAPICMSQLGDARRGCAYTLQVHGKLAEYIAASLDDAALVERFGGE